MSDGDRTTLLVSTGQALLRVALVHAVQGWRLKEVETLFDDAGVYFGLTRGPGEIFAVARNRADRSSPPRNPAYAPETILVLDAAEPRVVKRHFASAEWTSLHQLRYRDDLLWVVSGSAPELYAVEPATGSIAGRVLLSALVPEDLCHAAPSRAPEDRYHFNSLHFAPARLFAFAHNWDHGSFCLELEFVDAESFLSKPRLVRAWPALGVEAHDVFREGEHLTVLDSDASALRRTDGLELSLTGEAGEALFPRGLGANETNFFLGAGDRQPMRERREIGKSYLFVARRRDFKLEAGWSLGRFGDVTDVTLLGERDLADKGSTA